MLSVDGPSSSTFRGLNLSWNFSSAVDCQGSPAKLWVTSLHSQVAKGFLETLKAEGCAAGNLDSKSRMQFTCGLVLQNNYVSVNQIYIYIDLKNPSNTINSCLLHFLLGKHTPGKMDPPNCQFKPDNNTTMDSSNLVVDMTSPMPPNQDGFGQLHF